MEYRTTIQLKDGSMCILRNGTERDGKAVFDVFNLTHSQTDFLLSYPEENSYTPEQEGNFLKEKTESEDEIEIIAEVLEYRNDINTLRGLFTGMKRRKLQAHIDELNERLRKL